MRIHFITAFVTIYNSNCMHIDCVYQKKMFSSSKQTK